jgi:hypothetical protein
MRSPLRRAATAATVMLGLNGPGRPALAGAAGLTLHVRVDDHAAVSDAILRSAKAIATRIYLNIDVGLVWVGPAGSTPDGRADRETRNVPDANATFRIIIVAPGLADRVDADPKALGVAAGDARQSGHVAYVFYDRVRILSVRYEERGGAILGHVMAHELGHLLLPYETHAESGLMRMDWSREDLEHAAHGLLLFTPPEAALIRSRLSNHQPPDDEPGSCLLAPATEMVAMGAPRAAMLRTSRGGRCCRRSSDSTASPAARAADVS